MQRKLSPHVDAYVSLIRAAEFLHAEVSRGLLVEGLTPSQFSTLKILRQRGPQVQKDIASLLLKTGGNITLVVDNLEKLGFVARLKHATDRRISIIEITPAGADLFDRIYPGHLVRIEEAMSILSDSDCERLSGLLQGLGPDAGKFCEVPSTTARQSS